MAGQDRGSDDRRRADHRQPGVAGEGDGSFNAYDATTGDKLWSFQAGAGVNSAPMAFEIDGKLHVAVAAGGNAQLNYKRGDAVLVFALD